MSHWLGNSLKLGYPLPVGSNAEIELTPDDRQQHVYVVGVSRMGKTRFLESLIRQDIANWPRHKAGLLFIDPDGETFDRLMAWIPSQFSMVKRPIIPIDLRRTDPVVAYNPLRQRPGAEPSVVVDDVAAALANFWMKPGFIDQPLIQETVKAVLRGLYEVGGTLPDGWVLLNHAERRARRRMLEMLSDPQARSVLERANELTKQTAFRDELGPAARRFEPFFENSNLRVSLAQSGPSLDFKKAIEDGAIVLVCVGQQGSQVSFEQARLYATLLLSDLWRTVLSRGKAISRKPFYVYLDEFQNFILESIATSFNQAAGFGLHFTLAHQFPGQLLDAGDLGKRILNAVTNNAGTKVAFRLEHPDDLRFITDLLFLNSYDPLKRKLELSSPTVVGYETIILRGQTSADIPAGRTLTDGTTITVDAEGNPIAEVTSSSESESDPHTVTTDSQREALRPQLEERITSVQFWSPDEQTRIAMATLKSQNPRFGTVLHPRTGDRRPVPFQTRDTDTPRLSTGLSEKFYRLCVKGLPFVLSRAEADAELKERYQALSERREGDKELPEPTLPQLSPKRP